MGLRTARIVDGACRSQWILDHPLFAIEEHPSLKCRNELLNESDTHHIRDVGGRVFGRVCPRPRNPDLNPY